MYSTDPSEMRCLSLQGYLASKTPPPPPWNHHRALGTGLLQGPRRRLFLMSEVPLYMYGIKKKQVHTSRSIHESMHSTTPHD